MANSPRTISKMNRSFYLRPGVEFVPPQEAILLGPLGAIRVALMWFIAGQLVSVYLRLT